MLLTKDGGTSIVAWRGCSIIIELACEVREGELDQRHERMKNLIVLYRCAYSSNIHPNAFDATCSNFTLNLLISEEEISGNGFCQSRFFKFLGGTFRPIPHHATSE